MKPVYNPVSRRQFLVGTGGFTLALPLLPSLLPGDARAQQAAALQEASKRYFVYVGFSHAPFASQMFGPLLTQTPSEVVENYAGTGFQVRKAALPSSSRNGGTFISDILQTKTPMSAKVLRLMNVINGLDMVRPVGHFQNAYCGAIGGNDNNNSIDQVMAASPKLFRAGGESHPIISRRKTSRKLSQSSGFADDTAASNVALFNLLFQPGGGQQQQQQQQVAIVDKVNENYTSVRNDPNISAGCKTVLDNFMDLMRDTEARVLAASTGGSGSSPFPAPTVNSSAVESEQSYVTNGLRQTDVVKLWNSIVLTAFASGHSRIFVWGPPDNDNTTFSDQTQSSWHQDVAHNMRPGDTAAGKFTAAYQLQFESGMVDMANQLDSFTTSDGKTLLDKALLYSASEMGSSGQPGEHHGRSVPVVTIGNSNGFFNTGLSLDFRNKSRQLTGNSDPEPAFPGLPINQFLGMVLRSTGLTAADFAPGNTLNFYPLDTLQALTNNDYTATVWAKAQTDLPFLRGSAAPPTL